MGNIFKKLNRLGKKITPIYGGDNGRPKEKARKATEAAAAALAEREATTPVMPDEESLKRAARRRLAGSLGRTGRASTFLSDPSEGL